jgi:exopolysaccharide production protein ExoQ
MSAHALGWTRPAARPAAPLASAARLSYAGMRLLVAFLAIVSTSTFHDKLFGGIAPESVQQPLALGAWILLIGASFLVPRLRSLAVGGETAAVLAFFGFAVLSVLWSNHAEVSFLKGLALGLTTCGAYRVAVTMRAEDVVSAAAAGLGASLGVSLLLVLFVPEIGVVQYWMHAGQWSGLYQSKQSLGGVGAAVMLLAAYRYGIDRRRLRFGIAFALAVACVLGSGSRGGGAVALAGIAVLYLAHRSRPVASWFAFGPLVFTAVGLGLIAYFLVTEGRAIEVFGATIDITERTFIWAHGLRNYDQAFLFGYGLNGFWSDRQLLTSYEREHGWVLDNFHSGYITVLIETGAVGMALFVVMQTLVSAKLAAIAKAGAMNPWVLALIVSFLNTSFLINLTETGFLRSTSFLSVLLVIFLFMICLRPQVSTAAPSRAQGRSP